jgi:uncharacterized protein YcfJ
MIKNLLIGSVFLLTPISAVADTAMATVTNVIPNWVEVVSSTPQNVCTLQKVPVYQEVRKDGATGLEVLGGALLGGFLGKAVTKKDEGAIVGGVLGGVAVAEANRGTKTRIIGYKDEKVCNIAYVDRVNSVISDYTIYYEWNGYYGSSVVGGIYDVGDNIKVNVTLSH